jgi:hypothetical protein
MNCKMYPLPQPRVVAIAKDSYLTPKNPFPDPTNLPVVAAPRYGQDITSSYGRRAPHGNSVGTTPDQLTPKMRRLLSIFAAGDKSGIANGLGVMINGVQYVYVVATHYRYDAQAARYLPGAEVHFLRRLRTG